MKTLQKQVDYQISNTYSTLNTLEKSTKNVWIVCHGIGYLSRYFLKYFDELKASENYVIAPQAQSKYYLDKRYKHVGASWLTKENTTAEICNVLTYLDAVYRQEKLPQHCKLILFGYSQGVSIISRWLAKSKLPCDHLVLHSGGIPNELVAEDYTTFNTSKAPVTVIMGDEDPFLTADRKKREEEKMNKLFNGRAQLLTFEGAHVVHKPYINEIAR